MATDARVYVQREVDGPLVLRDVALAHPRGHEVLVKVFSAGICQSQIFWMRQPGQHPMLHGHEGYGEVVSVGDDVDSVRPGDRVLLTWIPRRPADDREPAPAAIDFGSFTAASHNVHCWATHTVVDELYVFPVPEPSWRPELAVVGCAVLTGAGAVRNSAGVRPGQSVVVIGLGGVGLSAAAAARIAGASEVIAVDIDDTKLAFAESFGATVTVNSNDRDLVEFVHGHVPGHHRAGRRSGVDAVIDCVGLPQTVEQGLKSVMSGQVGGEAGGKVIVVGAPEHPLVVDGASLLVAGKSLIGCRGGNVLQEEVHTFVDWVASGELNVERMVTDRYDFAELPAAVDALARGEILGRSIVLLD